MHCCPTLLLRLYLCKDAWSSLGCTRFSGHTSELHSAPALKSSSTDRNDKMYARDQDKMSCWRRFHHVSAQEGFSHYSCKLLIKSGWPPTSFPYPWLKQSAEIFALFSRICIYFYSFLFLSQSFTAFATCCHSKAFSPICSAHTVPTKHCLPSFFNPANKNFSLVCLDAGWFM